MTTLQDYSNKLEKILCKYQKYIPEGETYSGYEMADLIREVSGNELDASFVQLYLDYVETGKNGGILKWDITTPYNETKTMIKRKKLTKESDYSATANIEDIERMYGKDVAEGLLEYCRQFNKKPAQVMNDLTVDGNSQTEWDKFDNWLQRKKGIDFTDKFDDYDVDAELRKQIDRERETEIDAGEFERKMARIRKGAGMDKPKRRYASKNRFSEARVSFYQEIMNLADLNSLDYELMSIESEDKKALKKQIRNLIGGQLSNYDRLVIAMALNAYVSEL